MTLWIISIISLMAPSFFISLFKLTYSPLQNQRALVEYNNIMRNIWNTTYEFHTYQWFESTYLPWNRNYFELKVNPVSNLIDLNLIWSWTNIPNPYPNSIRNPDLQYLVELDRHDLNDDWFNDSVRYNIIIKEPKTNWIKSFSWILLF